LTNGLRPYLLLWFHFEYFKCNLYGASRPAEMYLPFIIDVSHQAHHLEYFAYHDNYQTIGGNHYWKRVCGEWVICDEVENGTCCACSVRLYRKAIR
jgi:hypothetical protein